MRTVCKRCLSVLWILIYAPLLLSQETRSFEDTVTVPIPEKDRVYARNRAFRTLESRLLVQAVKELIEVPLFEEYRNYILRQKNIVPKNYLDSVQIRQEYAAGEEFTMNLQGDILMSELKEDLRKLNLVLSDDPIVPIVLLLERGLLLPKEKLAERLRLFRIEIAEEDRVDASGIPFEERSRQPFIENLFDRFPDRRTIYFVEKVDAVSGEGVGKIRVRIYRSTDMSQIGFFGLKLVPPIPLFRQEAELHRILPRFLSLFTIHSCKRHLYNKGMESSVELELSGIHTPFLRHRFETGILKPDRNIQSFFLKTLSKGTAVYRLATEYSAASLVQAIERDNPHFDFYGEEEGQNRVRLQAFYKSKRRIAEPDPWETRQSTVDAIRKSYGLSDEEVLEEHLLPEIAEKEPNNTSNELNFLPPSTRLIGNISSRADEDIYQFRLPAERRAATLLIDWKSIGRTSLIPQLRIYDEKFDLLQSYSVSVGRRGTRIGYTLPDREIKELYLRISDAVGFLQGETGGYKSCRYLLRFDWKD